MLAAALGDSGGERHRGLHDAMTFLRLELSDFTTPSLNALWHEVGRRILIAATAALFRQRIDLDYNYMQLVGAGERVSVSFEPLAWATASGCASPKVGPSLRQAPRRRFECS